MPRLLACTGMALALKSEQLPTQHVCLFFLAAGDEVWDGQAAGDRAILCEHTAPLFMPCSAVTAQQPCHSYRWQTPPAELPLAC